MQSKNSVSSGLTASESVQLGNELRKALEESAARAEKLQRDLRTRMEAAEFRFKQELSTQQTQSEAAVAEAKSEFEAGKSCLTQRYEARVERIRLAYPATKRQGLEQLERQEGARKYPLQKGLLDTKRNRDEALKNNDAARAEFERQLDEARRAGFELKKEAGKAMRGYRRFRRMLRRPHPGQEAPARDEYQLLAEMRVLHEQAAYELGVFRRAGAAAVFRLLPVEVWVLLAMLAALAAALPAFGFPPVLRPQVAGGSAGFLVVVLGLYFYSRSRLLPRARAIAERLGKAEALGEQCPQMAAARHAAEANRIEREARQETERLQQAWEQTIQGAAAAREAWPRTVEEKFRRVSTRHERGHRTRMDRLQQQQRDRIDTAQGEWRALEKRLNEEHRARVERIQAENQAETRQWQQEAQQRLERLQAALREAKSAGEAVPWERSLWESWNPAVDFQTVARVGHIVFNAANGSPSSGESEISLPLVLRYPEQGSILFETNGADSGAVMAALNNIIFRLFASTPAGKSSFTLIDPVKLGQNFASVMHLADYEEGPLNGRIWTQTSQIEEKLGELNEHIEKVIQMYLRNEYPTLTDYNREAGNIAEKYHFVVVADFPANFSEAAAQRLLRIAASGARCGVFVLAHWDRRHALPPGFSPEEMCKNSVCVRAEGGRFRLIAPMAHDAAVVLDPPPAPEFATWFLHRIGQASRGSTRVEVSFRHVAPAPEEMWTVRTDEELRVPIGRSGATKLQYLSLGRGTRQHALIAGKTGSGKSTLFHGIITNLALWCSPREVEFYLVDFKKGVEFKCYATWRLPHARVVAIESDREFGLSVLERVDEELRRRGDLFRKAGVQDLAAYKATPGSEEMPRCLLLIDEFQELFVEDDRTAQAANVLLDRIVRQGRAFGIHVLLGSQTLGGAYTLARTTMGQMVVRIALQCNESDAYLIMDENNAAPRLLSRPGEGIYNDRAGAIEGNSPFQAVWLPEDERDTRLREIRAFADKQEITARPVVFEGNAPADVTENPLLDPSLRSGVSLEAPRVWLGAPNAIKGPTEAIFEPRGGANLLIVGQREEAVLTIFALSLVALAAQHRPDQVRLTVLDGGMRQGQPRDLLAHLAQTLPGNVTFIRPGEPLTILHQLAAELEQEQHIGETRTFLLIHQLHNFKKLRLEDEFALAPEDEAGRSAAADFQAIVSEGPGKGVHVIASLDTYNNVTRWLGRKMLSEFSLRMLFQMSAADSGSLCDDPMASTLGLHRALFVNDQQGYTETFRPYALPAIAWFDQTIERLARAAEARTPG